MFEKQENEYEEEVERDEAEENRILVFSVNNQSFAIEIEHINEIIEVLPIVRVPHIPDSVRGVVNLRGSIVPVIELRLRFGFERKDYDDRTCIIVLENNGATVGLIVDWVDEILNIPKDEIMNPTGNEFGLETKFLKGVGHANDGIQLILDCDKVVELS